MTPAALVFASLLMSAIVATQSAHAQTFHLLHAFTGPDGATPYASLIRDSTGNLYGTTSGGGTAGFGTVFKLDKTHTLTVLHSFAGGNDGELPYAGLIMDAAGNLYGTTYYGGMGTCGYQGCGTVFKVDKTGSETVLYSFTGGNDGSLPWGNVVRDKSGNLYGTTYYGQTIFKLNTEGILTTLHQFTGTDGREPMGNLVRDAAGSIYGTTGAGGTGCPNGGCGTVYKLDATRALTVLHSFDGTDGDAPVGGLIADGAGNLYGNTLWGGSSDSGTVFRVTEATGSFTLLHSFVVGTEGTQSLATLARDTAGNLYGANSLGGGGCPHGTGCGTIWKLDTNNLLTILTNLGKGNQGKSPRGGVVLDKAGNVYGTTSRAGGGCGQCGTVFKITP